MSNNRITPFVKRMRTKGGTIYTFNSALEDIGLNINERNNIVKISNFALLNIPVVNATNDVSTNNFNVHSSINGAFSENWESPSIKDGRVLIAESFQNYALNLEANILNQDTYNPGISKTISERVFWKWLKETGAIRWYLDASSNWVEEEDGEDGYQRVVKYVGQVSAGNIRTDNFGTYNETYILVPTSHGQTRVFFEQIEDDNYKHGMIIPDIENGTERILGREDFFKPHPDALSIIAQYDYIDSSTDIDDAGGTSIDLKFNGENGWWWSQYDNILNKIGSQKNLYIIDSSSYLDSSINVTLEYDGKFSFKRSNVDCMSLIWDESVLKEKYDLDPEMDNSEMYNEIAIEKQQSDRFNFNAVLIYYSVYNETEDDSPIETNLLGVLFLDAPQGNTGDIGFDGITIPSLEKIASGPIGFGTSYSLRLNIKTDSLLDDTHAIIIDQSTSDQLYAEDWNEVFYNLQRSVNILNQQHHTISKIYEKYLVIQDNQTQILSDIQELKEQINSLNDRMNDLE